MSLKWKLDLGSLAYCIGSQNTLKMRNLKKSLCCHLHFSSQKTDEYNSEIVPRFRTRIFFCYFPSNSLHQSYLKERTSALSSARNGKHSTNAEFFNCKITLGKIPDGRYLWLDSWTEKRFEDGCDTGIILSEWYYQTNQVSQRQNKKM